MRSISEQTLGCQRLLKAVPHCCIGAPQGSISAPVLLSWYLLLLGSILRNHGISFHCSADDSQIYVLLNKKDTFSFGPMMSCGEEIKAWMAVNFLDFIENKSYGFWSQQPFDIPSCWLGVMAPYWKPIVCNLGFRLDRGFKLDRFVESAAFVLLKWIIIN